MQEEELQNLCALPLLLFFTSFLSGTKFNALKWIILSDNWAWRFRPASAKYSAKKQQQWQSTDVCNSSCIYVHGTGINPTYRLKTLGESIISKSYE